MYTYTNIRRRPVPPDESAPPAATGWRPGCFQQIGNGHRPDATGHWRDCAGNHARTGVIDIADQSIARLAGNAINPHINHDRSGLEPAGIDQLWSTHRCNHDVRQPAQCRRIDTTRVHHADRAVGLQQQRCHGFANNVRAADDDGVQATQVPQVSCSRRMQPLGVQGVSTSTPWTRPPTFSR